MLLLLSPPTPSPLLLLCLQLAVAMEPSASSTTTESGLKPVGDGRRENHVSTTTVELSSHTKSLNSTTSKTNGSAKNLTGRFGFPRVDSLDVESSKMPKDYLHGKVLFSTCSPHLFQVRFSPSSDHVSPRPIPSSQVYLGSVFFLEQFV